MQTFGALQDTLCARQQKAARQEEMELAVVSLCDPRLKPARTALAARIERLEAALTKRPGGEKGPRARRLAQGAGA
jgi:hypothetical protein